ncbi:MAG TPA: Maf family protein, partial [Bacillales bacterium]|nr:Maf family protein [Bacillales bacterium]
KELLTRVSLSFDIFESAVDESVEEHETPPQLVQTLALRKAEYTFRRFPEAVVLGADTVVSLEGDILGKPKNETDAKAILSRLSGGMHTVYTGVAVISAERKVNFCTATDVTFWELSKTEIEEYLMSGEPFDKAGAYGIQGLGATFVKEIHGDYFNVVGLPLSRTVRALRSFGIAGQPGQSRRNQGAARFASGTRKGSNRI